MNNSTCICYSNTHRKIGEHALMTIRKHFSSTFLFLFRLCGLKNNIEYTKKELNYVLTELEMEINQYGEFSYKIPLDVENAENKVIPSESILAAFINIIKKDLIIGLHKKDIQSLTIAVPDFFTINQRESISRALKICNIEKYNIINESSAITLYYGFNKYKDLFIDTNISGKLDSNKLAINPNTSKFIMFIDFGHSKTSLVLSELKPTFFRVANCTSNAFLGGRDIDKLIFNHLSEIFFNKYKIDVSQHKKSAIRLLEQVTKARKILTGNQETVINIDCLYEDYDFSYLLTRNEFESLIKPIRDEFYKMIEVFYKSSTNVIDKGISAIEMVGECMRTPIFQTIVKEVTGKELQKSIIVDEAVSKGSAMYSALMNNSLPLQSFNGIYHFNPYTIVYETEKIQNLLCNRGEMLPNNKSIDIQVSNNDTRILKILFSYLKQESEFFMDGSVITEIHIDLEKLFKINNVDKVNLPDNSNITIDFLIDNSGKLHLQNIRMSHNQNLTINIDALCIKTNLNKYSQIKGVFEENKIVNELKIIENAHVKQDEFIRDLHNRKNNLESCIYKLKNKYYQKADTYETAHQRICKENKTLLSKLEHFESILNGSEQAIDDLEFIQANLSEIEDLMSDRKIRGPNFLELNKSLNYYSNLLDSEYVNLLEAKGKNTRFDEKTINLVSEILSKYRILLENSEEVDIKSHLFNLKKEMKKYF